ncbi:ATP-dependent helicase HrpB [Nocardioides acrostichi]|uniref:ATP-dependent helicase HrpB n=1 Tax=Nocardioides acrostichi TaxID=2784339 RepID=A0A930V1T4_9ACTN|nr:ATP-dependent helicase HrpB [Nocardioides acrostichi]MBF4162165.1 ATP-dependent helicase HrpB [Nocardioides acrostichi]
MLGHLPVEQGLAAIERALRDRGAVVVQAPPGSGKTTLVPPRVASIGPGRVIVTQPRRIAARAAAARMAELAGEPLGRRFGYAVRGERRSGPDTRVEVVTTGLLVRRLQADPELSGVTAVVLDEVHERSIDADLALALLLDVRAALRPDLRLVAMSATVAAERFATLLDADVVSVPGSPHPLAVRWAPAPTGVRPLDDRGVTPAFLDHVAAVAAGALTTAEGDVLVFVPGVREVDQVVRRLDGVAVPLHGRLTAKEQDAALRPTADGARRVIVSTAVAESSLTVPGVRAVVDAGLSREPRFDRSRGMGGLVTVRVSRASAEQRGGRAARTGPGTVHRCWSQAEHAHLAEHPLPEIATADLTPMALQLACWGARLDDLALPDPPLATAWQAAQRTLRDLDAVDEAGTLTATGRSLGELPVDPRLGRALLVAAPQIGARAAAEVVALLADDVRGPDVDLVAGLRRARRERPRGWVDTVRRLEALAGDSAAVVSDDVAAGLVVALAHPERIARRRASGDHVTVGGTGVRVEGSLAAQEWLAVAHLDRRHGERDARVRSAVPISEDVALGAAGSRLRELIEAHVVGGKARARAVVRLGAIEVSSTPIGNPPADVVTRAWSEALARGGLDQLRWSDAARNLRERLAFLHAVLGEPWPDVADDALLERAEEWLGTDPSRLDLAAALRGLLPWPQAGRLDELAPPRLSVPSGSSYRVDYAAALAVEAEGQPVLAVKLQECFGWAQTPAVVEGRVRVLLHLLSPAGRPLAVTSDLASFWENAYPGVRAEMRGRYPKHPWPEDPWSHVPTRRVRSRLSERPGESPGRR